MGYGRMRWGFGATWGFIQEHITYLRLGVGHEGSYRLVSRCVQDFFDPRSGRQSAGLTALCQDDG